MNNNKNLELLSGPLIIMCLYGLFFVGIFSALSLFNSLFFSLYINDNFTSLFWVQIHYLKIYALNIFKIIKTQNWIKLTLVLLVSIFMFVVKIPKNILKKLLIILLVGVLGTNCFLFIFSFMIEIPTLSLERVILLSMFTSFLLMKYFNLDVAIKRLGDPTIALHDIFKYDAKKSIHGSAEFMGNKEQQEILNPNNNGLILDGVDKRISSQDSFKNTLLIAPTGSGKSTSYVIPNLLNISKGSSIVVTDPSGELFDKTSGYLESIGKNIIKVDVFDENSVSYNPLLNIRTLADAKNISKTLILQVAGKDPFWNISASNYISSYLLLCRDMSTDKINYLNFRNLKEFIAFSKSELNEFLEGKENITDETKLELKAALSGSANVRDTTRALALTSIELFSEQPFTTKTATNTLDIKSVRQKESIMYICMPEHKIQKCKAFLSLLYTDIFNTFLETKGYPTYFLIDEFANIGRIYGFESIITTSRKRDISISLIIQDIQQVAMVYGKNEASTIVSGGCFTKMVLSGTSNETAKFLSELCGTETIETQSQSIRSGSGDSKNVSTASRKLLNPDEVRRLNSDEALLVYGNKQPIKLNIKPCYKNKELVERMKMPSAKFYG